MNPMRPVRQTRRRGVGAIFLALSLATVMARAQAPEENPGAPSNSASSANSKGTGIVPPGVKLLPDQPAAAAPKEFHFPQAATKTLSNGLRVFVVTDHSEPAVATRLVILSAGSIEDPKGIPGVAKMTAGLLTQGTEKRSAQQIAETIDFVGGSLDASAGKDSTAVTLNIVKKDLATGLDLMSDVVLHPAFQAEELERQRQQLLSGLTVQYSDPEYLASAAFARTLYEGSAYGWPDDGTPESAKAFTRDLFVKFHDANYAPNTSLLAFAGDIDPDEAFAAAEKYFGGWARQPMTMTASAAPNPMHGVHVWLIDKPDAVQTQIRVGKLGISRSDPDYIPVVVMNRIFGGGYNSRLNTEVRVKKGLTYGAYSSFDPHRYAGTFSVSTFTRTPATVQATRLAVDLIAQMAKGDVMPKELDFSRDYLAGVYPIQSESAEQVANRVLTVAAFDLPADYNSTYPDRIRSVSVDQVDQMAKKYLQPGDLDIVLAGNVGAFRDELKKAFPDAQYQEVRFDHLDLLAPGLRRAQP